MENNWVVVFSSDFTYVIELAQGILKQNDINSIMLNKNDSMHIHLLNEQVELYVAKEDEIQAKHYLSKMKL